MTQFPCLAAARERSDGVDRRIAELSAKLNAVSDSIAVVAVGAYGRRELTPRTDVELLFLHQGELSTPWVTEAVCYPLWEHNIRVEPSVRTLMECAADARRSWSAATSFLDARFVTGNVSVFDDFVRQVAQPWRRDRGRLSHRLRIDAQDRHATHASAAASAVPDLMAGRGGLLDLHALRWLEPEQNERLIGALDFLLGALSAVEELVEPGVQEGEAGKGAEREQGDRQDRRRSPRRRRCCVASRNAWRSPWRDPIPRRPARVLFHVAIIAESGRAPRPRGTRDSRSGISRHRHDNAGPDAGPDDAVPNRHRTR